MKPSSKVKVSELYENSSASYAGMMDAEIEQAVYTDILGRLAKRIAELPGPVVDTSCGSGHMLHRYRENFDKERPVIGIDLSQSMVAIAQDKLGCEATVLEGDMRDLPKIESDTAAAIVSFFAIHHIDAAGIQKSLREWKHVLVPGGQLVLAAWEGDGPIGYGDSSDVVALKYSRKQIQDWVEANGFSVSRLTIAPIEELQLDAAYLEATLR